MDNSDLIEVLELAVANLEEARNKLQRTTERFKVSESPYDLNAAISEILNIQGWCRLDWLIQRVVFKCFDADD